MKLRNLACIMVVAVCCLTACGSNDKDTNKETTTQAETTEGNVAASAKKLLEQGNPKKINLVDIVEGKDDDWKAWIKVSTAFDPTLSVYSTDSVPAGTQAIVVTFKVDNMDCEQQEMYWCYQLITADGTVSLWNDTSAADKLTVIGDGTYQFVFDATKALGGAIQTVESFQMVLPGLTETTTTTVEFVSAVALTDAKDISMYESKKLD
ncbi:MAG: hypothetical protein E7266_06910 [Lachnospiraceae bacterium]|nr:hypothetical protein [Lachnospiraceae bacterium]